MWKEFGKHHRVNELGEVQSKASGQWKPLKSRAGKDGYKIINISKKTFTIHRLVLEAFVGPRPEDMECRHLDGNPTNNRLDNLAWGYHWENMEDVQKHNKRKLTNTRHRERLDEDTAAKLWALRLMGFGSTGAAKFMDVPEHTVRNIFKGLAWNHVSGLPKYVPKP
jgi:hypothetical protein